MKMNAVAAEPRALACRTVALAVVLHACAACGGEGEPPPDPLPMRTRPASVVTGAVTARDTSPTVHGRDLNALVLGAPSLFDGTDLSGIAAGGLFVSAIEHEAFIEVDEEGTRAAAATGVAVADSHGPTIAFDRPFLFFIVDRPTRTLLFLGRVADPR